MPAKFINYFKKIKIIFIFLIFIFLGYSGTKFYFKSTAKRTTASVDFDRGPQGKNNLPIRVQIIQPKTIPENDNQEIELQAYVTVSAPINGDVYYEWILPEGVSIIEGNKTDSWANLPMNQTAVAKITVVGFSQEQRKIASIEAYAMVGEHKIGNSSTLSSRPQDSMEYIAPEKMESRQEFEKQKSDH